MNRLEEERQAFKNALKSIDDWDALATTLGCYPGMLRKRVEELNEKLEKEVNASYVLERKLSVEIERAEKLEVNANDLRKALGSRQEEVKRYKQALEEILKSKVSIWGFHEIARKALKGNSQD